MPQSPEYKVMANKEQKSAEQKPTEQKSTENQGLLDGIGAEVSAESAPLLEFITQNAGKIAGVVLLLVLLTAISAGWQWYQNKQTTQFLDEMAKLDLKLTGADKLKAMEELVAKAPSKLTAMANLSLGDMAIANQNPELAITAYQKAAQADADGATGLMAALGQAQSLMRLAKNNEAFELISALESRLGTPTPLVVLQLKAEAALASGRTDVAQEIFAAMAKNLKGEEAAYLLSRAEKLKEQNQAAPAKKAEPTEESNKAKN